ncbi:MAG: hypothetical protein JOS17DRAFT_760698 [Linnemannia elongata]|nr:MAG: hypothetical protein JOS17DRAFT_760698 [Linnemannia elongata]
MAPWLRQESMAHLTSLQPWYLREDLSEAEFRSMLAHCPNLTTIFIPPVHSIQHPQHLGQEIAQQLCPKLTNVELEYLTGDITIWELLFRIPEALPEQQVQKFDCLEQSFLIPGLTSEVAGSLFRRHSTTLREIVLAGCWNIDSKVIQTILVECWALERLEVQFKPLEGPNYQQQQQPLCISLEDAIEFTWGCAKSRTLTWRLQSRTSLSTAPKKWALYPTTTAHLQRHSHQRRLLSFNHWKPFTDR